MKTYFITICYENNICNFLSGISQEVIISLLGTILIFSLLLLRNRFLNYVRLKKFNGNYYGFDNKTQEKHENNKVYQFQYLFWKNKIKLSQKSTNKGDWETYFLIDFSNPFVCISTFNYLNSGQYSGNWGTMQIWLNKDNNEIVIESTPKNVVGLGSVTYLLKRNKL